MLAYGRGVGGGHRRKHLHRRSRRRPRPRQGPRRRDGVPVLRPLSAHVGCRQHGLRLEAAKDSPRRDRPPHSRGGDHPGYCRGTTAQTQDTVGRAAAARCAGAGDRAGPGGLPVRRAALQLGRQIANGDAGRVDQASSQAFGDDDLCHARSDRGDDHGGSHRRHERGAHPAERHTARRLRQSRQHIRRGLHRQPGDEPDRRRGRAGRRLLDLSGRRARAQAACDS